MAWRWMVGLVVLSVACGDDEVGDTGGGDGSGDSSSASVTTTSSSSASATTSADDTAGSSGEATEASASVGTDTGASDCMSETFSDLPGVALDVATGQCEYSLAAAQAGVLTSYMIAVQDELADVDSGNDCFSTPPGSVLVTWRVYADEHLHCQCDVGLCPRYVPMPTTLPSGPQEGEFTWHAFDWAGESDTNNPFGDPFPPGEYTVEVRVTGTWNDPVAGTTPFEMWARQPVTLVP